jgi:four helix bundle protein
LLQAEHDLVLRHIALQLVRSSTSPAANYGEARAAESRRDFIHKMQICLKELRETAVWLRFRTGIYGVANGSKELTRECQELMLIIGAGIRTARRSK